MSTLALLLTAALLAAAIAALLPDGSGRRTPGSLAIWPGTIAAVIATLGLASALATHDDVAGAALTTLIVALTVVVQAFASRSLRGDPRARGFFVLSALAALGSTTSAAAGDVVLFATGWTVATVSTVALVASGGAGAQTRVAARRTAGALLLGDVALWVAVIFAASTTGSTSFASLVSLDDASAAIVAVLVAVAAIARAGSFPLHGWLPATAAATTPVSALLHAGFVNAGALLLLRFAVVPSAAGAWVVGLAGAVTMIVATLAMLTRPDVKGRLVHSTAAQMGFMLMACAVGAFGLALAHALGHALFKASLFLGTGSAVSHAVRERTVARLTPSHRGAVAGAIIVLAIGTGTAILTGAPAHDAAVLLLFALATATAAGARIGSSSAPHMIRVAWLAILAVAVIGYVALLFPAAEKLVPAHGAAVASPFIPTVVFLCAAASLLAIRLPGPLTDRLFALAFAWGRPGLPAAVSRTHTSSPSALAEGPLEYRRIP